MTQFDWVDEAHERCVDDDYLQTVFGVNIYKDLDDQGLSRSKVPSAYNGTRLRPVLVITGPNTVPLPGMADKTFQYTNVRQRLIFWVYNDRDAVYLTEAEARIYELFHERSLLNAFSAILINRFKTFAPELGGAKLLRLDYEVTARVGG